MEFGGESCAQQPEAGQTPRIEHLAGTHTHNPSTCPGLPHHMASGCPKARFQEDTLLFIQPQESLRLQALLDEAGFLTPAY